MYSIRRSHLNIPIELDYPGAWHPTTGHKANTNFGDSINAVFRDFEHPRWGAIESLSATKDIKAGEEIFADYNYPKKTPSLEALYKWYYDALEDYEARKWKEAQQENDRKEAKSIKKPKKKKKGKAQRSEIVSDSV